MEKSLPQIKIENDCLLSSQGDITLGFEMSLPEIFTLSGSDYSHLHASWVKALRILPNHSILHKMDWFTNARYQANFEGPEKTFLASSSERFFNERPFLDHRCYLFLTKMPAGRRHPESAFTSLLRQSMVPEQTLNTRMLREFLDNSAQFTRILEDSGFLKLRRLKEADLFSTKDHPGIIERYCQLTEDKSIFARDISLDRGIRIGADYCQLYTLADPANLPPTCAPDLPFGAYSTDKTPFSIGFAASLGSLLPCNHIYNQYLFIDDARKTLKKFEGRRLRLQSLSAWSRENALSMQATHDFLNEAIGQQRLPVKAHFNVFAWTDDKEELNTIRRQVASAIAHLDATPKEETVSEAQIWWAGMPGNEADFPMNETFDTFTEQACCFLNHETNYRSSLSPFGIRLGDRLTGRPIHVDLDDEPKARGLIANGNMFLLAGSGGGKSFFTNHLARSYYEQGTHILIVDVGHSYQVQCMLHKGYYFTYEQDRPIAFNPFWLPEGDTLDTEKKESIKALLLALWKKSDESYNRSEYVALSSALQRFYEWLEQNPDVFPCFDAFYDYLREHFVAVLEADKVKEKDFDMSNFLYVLRPYYKGGEFDFLLNATENLDLLHERFIVFELDSIKDHPILFPVVTLIIMEAFIAKMRKLKGVRKFIIIEEAWKAIAKEGMAEYIRYLFKTVRKFHGKAAVVTQEVEDIISSEIIRQAIINNSDCKILLDQSKFQNRFDQVQDLLGITDKQKAEILSLNKAHESGRQYKDVWIGLGPTHSRVYRLETSPEEYYTYTSDQREKMQVLESIEKHGGDTIKGIRALAASMAVSEIPAAPSGSIILSPPLPATTTVSRSLVSATPPTPALLIILSLLFLLIPRSPAKAQLPIADIITAGIKKVVQAADLQVQRLQNKTLALQNAQKELENILSQTRLAEIADWVDRQRQQYADYYEELREVKVLITGYAKLARILKDQAAIASSWQKAFALTIRDPNFSPEELDYIEKVYQGMVDESAKAIDQALLATTSLTTQMDDAARLTLIDRAAAAMDKCRNDLHQFTEQNIRLSLQRGLERNDLQTIKSLYGR